MPTKNIVPRSNNEGSLGTAAKNWLAGFFQNVTVSGVGNFVPHAVTSAAGSLTVDFAAGNVATLTLSENITAVTLTNAVAGSTLKLWVTQAAGGYTLSGWPANVKWVGGAAPTITATDAAVDIVTMEFDGTNFYAAITQDHR